MNFLKKLFNKKKNPKFWVQGNCNIDEASTFHGCSSAQEYCTIKNADVGRYVSMADFVSIGVEEPDFDKISTSSFINGKSKLNRTTVKNDVWFGVDTLVKNGVTIGNGAVIGSNSYVREDVPDFAIVGGNPAKIIRYRFNEETREKILNSKYWEKDPIEAKEIVTQLQNEYDLKKENHQ